MDDEVEPTEALGLGDELDRRGEEGVDERGPPPRVRFAGPVPRAAHARGRGLRAALEIE